MMDVPSRFVALRERRVADLDAFLEALEVERRQAVYSVGWIDALARGRALGRGIVEAADPAPAEAGGFLRRGQAPAPSLRSARLSP